MSIDQDGVGKCATDINGKTKPGVFLHSGKPEVERSGTAQSRAVHRVETPEIRLDDEVATGCPASKVQGGVLIQH